MKLTGRIITLFLVLLFSYAGFTYYGYSLLQKDLVMLPLSMSENDNIISSTNAKKIQQANFDSTGVESATTQQYAAAKLLGNQAVRESGVGRLIIPNVTIQLPILAGVNERNLLNGATMYRKDQHLGVGNYVLMSHNLLDADTLLYRIKDLKKGDDIYLTDGSALYVYQTFYNKRVDFSNGELLLNPEDNQAIVTLFRCEGGLGTPWRRVVQGKYLRKLSLKNLDDGQRKQLNVSASSDSKEPISGLAEMSRFQKMAIKNIHFFLDNYFWIFILTVIIMIALLIILALKFSQPRTKPS